MDVFRRLLGGRRARSDDGAGFEPPNEGWLGSEQDPTQPEAFRIAAQDERSGAGAIGRYFDVAGRRFRRSPVFAPFNHLTVGLSYDGASLKLLVCEQRRVVSWETIPFDPRMLSGAVIAEPYNLGRLLADAFARRTLPAYRVHCAVPASGAISRVVEVPRLGGRERRRIATAEALRGLGVSPGRHYVYWHAIDDQPDLQLLFVLAVPRDVVRSLVETMRAAGIRPRSVDIQPLALARGVGQPDAIVVELDPTGVDLAIVLDDVPLVIRSLLFGDQALTLEEAQEAAVDLIATELRRFEDVYVGSRVEPTVPIFLAGDLGSGLRLADRIRSATGHPVGRPAPMIDYAPDFPIGEYLANVGLVLKEDG